MCRDSAPWVSLEEAHTLIHRLNQTADHSGFYSVPMQKALFVRLMKWFANGFPHVRGEKGVFGRCPFYDAKNAECMIYDLRPLLCRYLAPGQKIRVSVMRLVNVLSLPAALASWYAKRFGISLTRWPHLVKHFKMDAVRDVEIARLLKTHHLSGSVKPRK